MRTSRALVLLLILAACASEQVVTLLPRGQGPQGRGTLSRVNNQLVVEIDGRTYRGPATMETETRANIFGVGGTTYTKRFTALLLGDAGGQVRCEYGFDSMYIRATGICVDYHNVTYDLLIQNPDGAR